MTDAVGLHAVAVTYGRPTVLAETLGAFRRQTRPPDTILVVDNGADPVVCEVVASIDEARYVAMPENAGPAGAIAEGMSRVLEWAGPHDWVLLVDDDDPPRFETAVADVLAVAQRAPGDVAVVGLTGARYRRRTGRLLRVPDEELADLTDVDYVGNGQCPVYRVAALRDAGVFDPGLFFQFEELEYGLRLRERGWRLVVNRDLTLRLREETGRLRLGRSARVNRAVAPWRTYYAARNQVVIARRHGTAVTPLVVTARQIAGGCVRAVRARSTAHLRARVVGLSDGWRDRVGRTVEPTVSAGGRLPEV